ncbi:integrase [Streptomyces sp. NPDC006879]|uniref:integrase n=1 Tax=Streptomyces sp. NPDC006879 TaxID=3364767 RepID=UPI0036A48C34
MASLRRRGLDLSRSWFWSAGPSPELQNGKLADKAPKSAAGVRPVVFPAELVPELAHHLEHFAAAGQDGHLFQGPPRGGLLRRSIRDDWTTARTAAGVPGHMHFRVLCHTGNTPASSVGAGTRELMTLMGHSTTRAADLPAHAELP